MQYLGIHFWYAVGGIRSHDLTTNFIISIETFQKVLIWIAFGADRRNQYFKLQRQADQQWNEYELLSERHSDPPLVCLSLKAAQAEQIFFHLTSFAYGHEIS